MDPATIETLTIIGLCALYGATGQLIRSGIGLYKLRLKDGAAWEIDWTFYSISIMLGALSGVIVGVILDTADPKMIIPFGYVGVDALEGLLNKRVEARIAKG